MTLTLTFSCIMDASLDHAVLLFHLNLSSLGMAARISQGACTLLSICSLVPVFIPPVRHCSASLHMLRQNHSKLKLAGNINSNCITDTYSKSLAPNNWEATPAWNADCLMPNKHSRCSFTAVITAKLSMFLYIKGTEYNRFCRWKLFF